MSFFIKLIVGIFLGIFLLFCWAAICASEESQAAICNPDFGTIHFNSETRNLVVLDPKDTKAIVAISRWEEYDKCWWKHREKLEDQLVFYGFGIGGVIITFVMNDTLEFIRQKCFPGRKK